MIKKTVAAVRSCTAVVLGLLFVLVAAPVIHLSGLDKVDSCPTPDEIEKSKQLAASLKRERKNDLP